MSCCPPAGGSASQSRETLNQVQGDGYPSVRVVTLSGVEVQEQITLPRILYPHMINIHQAFFKDLFDLVNVPEGDIGIDELVGFCQVVNNLINQLVNGNSIVFF